ncbi:MAG: serine/threonine-protein phosphatase [Proteobacteria bacterium]|nr:serine/threonine-protein phosphatase [Pseudomonadota bacterium]
MAGIQLGTAQILGARQEQQDAFDFTDKDDSGFVEYRGVLAVVADGIGGHAHGGEASRKAVAAFMQHYQAKPRKANIQNAIYHALIQANHAVLDFAESQGEIENCGTTLIAAALHPDSRTLHWIGVGDSRLYLFRDGQLVQLTVDANVRSHLIKKFARGILSRDGLDSEENPHRLTSFLGLKKLGRIDRSIRPFPLHQGDRALICTDGVYQALGREELVECLSDDPQTACDRIVQSILNKQLEYQDNATVAVLAFGLKESPQVVLRNVAGLDRRNETALQGEPLNVHANGKARLLWWSIAVVALLIVFVAVWFSNKVEKVAEDQTVMEIKLPALKKSDEPRKPIPNFGKTSITNQ